MQVYRPDCYVKEKCKRELANIIYGMSRLYSNILKNVIIPLADKVMHTRIKSYYQLINKMQTWSKEDILNWQFVKLKKLIEHAYNNTEYYQELFDKHGIKPENITKIEDLKKIPILTKSDIIKNYNELTPKNINTIPHLQSATGGSTGDPMKFLLGKASWSFSNAAHIFNWEKTGYNYGDKYIALGSTSLFVNKNKSLTHTIYYKLKNKIGLNGVNMSARVCGNYVTLIQKKRIRFIYGYASAIYLLAKYVQEKNIKLNIDVCFPTSEVLTDVYKNTIKEAFKCKVLDGYGASDGGITAFDHKGGCFEVGYNTIISTINKDADISELFLTDTLNYAMPLINYKIGDEVIMNDPKAPPCEYNGQIINKVLGRTSEIIELENGNVLTGPGFTILFKDIPVEYYYIEKNGVNSINCTIIKFPSYEEKHEKIIYSTFRKMMGQDSTISINYSDKIKYTSSGKRKYFCLGSA